LAKARLCNPVRYRRHRSNWACFVFACSVAISCASTAAGGQHGSHQGEGHHGGSQKAGGGHTDNAKGHETGSHQGAGHHGGSQKGGGGHTDSGKGHETGSHQGAGHHGDSQKGGGGHTDKGKDHAAGSHEDEGHHGGLQKGSGGDPSGSRDNPSVNEETLGTAAATLAVAAANAAAVATTFLPSTAVQPSVDLPPILLPRAESRGSSLVGSVEVLPGVPTDVVSACRKAIESAAVPFGGTNVRVTSAGFMYQLSADRHSAPIRVSIDYAWHGGVETRQAPITCQLNARGDVIGLI
jgi:hypothetical protein